MGGTARLFGSPSLAPKGPHQSLKDMERQRRLEEMRGKEESAGKDEKLKDAPLAGHRKAH